MIISKNIDISDGRYVTVGRFDNGEHRFNWTAEILWPDGRGPPPDSTIIREQLETVNYGVRIIKLKQINAKYSVVYHRVSTSDYWHRSFSRMLHIQRQIRVSRVSFVFELFYENQCQIWCLPNSHSFYKIFFVLLFDSSHISEFIYPSFFWAYNITDYEIYIWSLLKFWSFWIIPQSFIRFSIIVQSQPQCNNILLAGSALCSASLFLMGLPTAGVQLTDGEFTLLCHVSPLKISNWFGFGIFK